MQSDIKKRIGILRGGVGENYVSSLNEGGGIIAHILENLGDKYKTVDILIDHDGFWHLNGLPVRAAELPYKVDMVWNVAHPEASSVLDSFSIPYIGKSAFSHTLLNSREMLREHIKKIGVGMPRSILIAPYQADMDGPRERYSIKKAKAVHEKFGAPWIVQSFAEDKSMGIHVAKTFNELVGAIEDGVNHGKGILVEEFIEGKPSAVHTIPDFRGEEVYVMIPDNFSISEKEEIGVLARNLHGHLGGECYLKTDFILSPRRGLVVTNIDFSPDLRANSHLHQACQSVGAKMNNIVEHMLEGVIN
ncbi:MAG TPA: hypothetical protein VJC14_00925 [Candidatus Paceibacterota bacterium]